MYNCEVCDTTTAPGTELNRIPEGYRVTRYRRRADVNTAHVPWKKKAVVKDDPGGVGYEWKGMLKACPTCYANYEAEVAEEMIEKAEDRVEDAMAAK